ncbi:unnamed protein product [Candidula unifasciata]|uniref:Uncharacterized protein n=1 Tax=Candidula unifasciata TaxID=100452 RepID=A0A8S3ZT42_9EUPU|nr:unnamed protein product [Candidula unifasciata]
MAEESPMMMDSSSVMMVAHQEGEEIKVDAEFGEFDDCSSGSDRSFDDVDSNGRCETGTNANQGINEHARSRRRRRHGSRRHKGGSRHKHKGYQPYPSKEEIEGQLKRKSLELQEKENAAAVVRREGADQQFITFPIAPFNSTQFLMDEHNANSPASLHKTSSSSVLNSCSPQGIRLNSVPSTPAESSHETIVFEKKDKEFSDYFTTVHAESLQSLPKDELVKHYMNLEEKVAALQKKVAEQQQHQYDDCCSKMSRHIVKVCVCESIRSNLGTNSLAANMEDFTGVSEMNTSSISVGESSMLNTIAIPSSTSGDTWTVFAESAS